MGAFIRIRISSSESSAIKKTDKVTLAKIKAMLAENGILLTREAVMAMTLTDSPQVALAQAWMDRFFSMVGDPMPNKNEIHLDAIHTINSIYNEYVGSVHALFPNADDICGGISKKAEYVSITYFQNIWRTGFNHVKLRMFKQVCDVVI